MSLYALALRFHATADDLIDQLFVYPTMAEALNLRRSRSPRTSAG